MLADGPLLGDEQDCFNGKTPQPLGVTVGTVTGDCHSGEEEREEKGQNRVSRPQ